MSTAIKKKKFKYPFGKVSLACSVVFTVNTLYIILCMCSTLTAHEATVFNAFMNSIRSE